MEEGERVKWSGELRAVKQRGSGAVRAALARVWRPCAAEGRRASNTWRRSSVVVLECTARCSDERKATCDSFPSLAGDKRWEAPCLRRRGATGATAATWQRFR